MTLILKDLEKQERYKECAVIVEAMKSFIIKFNNLPNTTPTKWSKEFEERYYSYFYIGGKDFSWLVTETLKYIKRDINNRLNLKL